MGADLSSILAPSRNPANRSTRKLRARLVGIARQALQGERVVETSSCALTTWTAIQA